MYTQDSQQIDNNTVIVIGSNKPDTLIAVAVLYYLYRTEFPVIVAGTYGELVNKYKGEYEGKYFILINAKVDRAGIVELMQKSIEGILVVNESEEYLETLLPLTTLLPETQEKLCLISNEGQSAGLVLWKSINGKDERPPIFLRYWNASVTNDRSMISLGSFKAHMAHTPLHHRRIAELLQFDTHDMNMFITDGSYFYKEKARIANSVIRNATRKVKVKLKGIDEEVEILMVNTSLLLVEEILPLLDNPVIMFYYDAQDTRNIEIRTDGNSLDASIIAEHYNSKSKRHTAMFSRIMVPRDDELAKV